jgi:hypothetical protein
VGFARSGFFAPFFLLPVGLAAYRFGWPIAWLTALIAALANAAISLFWVVGSNGSMNSFLADALYFGSVTLVFAWAVVDRDLHGGPRRIRTAYRLVIAAVIATVATIPVILLAKSDEGLISLIRHQAEGFIAAYTDAAGADVVARSLIEKNLNPEAMIQAIGDVYMRGAAVLGHAVFFFMSWRIALLFASFGNPQLRRRGSFALFHLDAYVIWPLISAFVIVLLGVILKFFQAEILGWNLLALCLLLYLAQGYGIVQYHLMRPGIPRSIGPLVTLIVALAFLRPGINAIVAGAIAALGIAENWLPLRAPIKTEPPSTPGA